MSKFMSRGPLHLWLAIFNLACLALPPSLEANSISDKKKSFEQRENESISGLNDQLAFVNEDLWENRQHLEKLYQRASELYRIGAEEATYCQLLEQINEIRASIETIESQWREESASAMPNDAYALWHQPDTNLLQLVMDYGAQDYVYYVPPEIGMIRVSINSNLPIPRESWESMLELILAQNGVGSRQLNPYLRELYLVRQDPSGLKHITNRVKDLDILSGQDRICFMLSTQGPDPRNILQFLQKFSNPITTNLQIICGDIFIVSTVDTIKELLKLYEFVNTSQVQQDYQLVTLSKVNAKEMGAILTSAFPPFVTENPYQEGSSSLRVIPLSELSRALFLCGSKEEVSKALRMVKDIESQIEDPREKTVFWYTAKHSEAEELAQVLAKVYDLLCATSSPTKDAAPGAAPTFANVADTQKDDPSTYIVTPTLIEPTTSKKSHRTADGQNNFIVDAKTGSIIMVVEQDALPKIKDLLRKLDVPKKMVQIEVLLFEKKITNRSSFGLNLLRIGAAASDTLKTGLTWFAGGPSAGILEFLFSRKAESGIPAYDLAYNFMLGQEDVKITASPSITTVNQTPARIAIVEEISINTGAELDNSGDIIKDAFSRAQYGIVIQITPTINIGESNEDGLAFITLDTDINFDTTEKKSNDRPEVTRRNIKNHVRIADGQTVILGGLRRKSTSDSKDSIPFLGEIPGLGKLFSSSGTADSSTEMFIFLTPKIIYDPIEDVERIKYEELCKRPGDLPELLHEILEAKSCERKRLFEGSLTALFGRQEAPSISKRGTYKEYEGK